MEDFGPRSRDGRAPLRFPAEIRVAMANAQASFYIASTRLGEFHSFRVPMTNLVGKYRLRHAHMPGFVKEMMSQGMAADYIVIQRLSRKVYNIASKARRIRVTTPAGTDLTVDLSPKLKWGICDGRIQPGKWTNLPDGEVFTAPADANGLVVIDGCMGDIVSRRPGSMKTRPLSYEILNARCVRGSVRCRDKVMKKIFERYTFGTDANSDRAGEFAIGTNVGLKKLIGNMLQDEKFPSVHLALGDPLCSWTGAGWSSKAHNDGLMLAPTVAVDGRTIMKGGKFTI
jgi:leucyl aminopeptidase (aminopeptidase T)